MKKARRSFETFLLLQITNNDEISVIQKREIQFISDFESGLDDEYCFCRRRELKTRYVSFRCIALRCFVRRA